MASHQETIFGKYFAAGAKGGGAGLELPPYAVEHTEMLYNKARGRPLGYMFDVAQAFVYQVCVCVVPSQAIVLYNAHPNDAHKTHRATYQVCVCVCVCVRVFMSVDVDI